MGTGPGRNAVVAIALIVIGIALPSTYAHWLYTRTFVPLDIPVSLSPGHIRTNDFYINLKETYYVEINVDEPFTYKRDCPLYGSESVLKTHLILFRGGQKLGEADGLGYFFIEYFDADKKGHYRLDVQILSDASCVSAGHPRLVVLTGSARYRQLLQAIRWFSLTPIVGGLGLLFVTLASGAWKRLRQSPGASILEVSTSEQGSWPPGFRQAKPLSRLPSFGLLCGTVLAFLVIAFLFIQSNRPVPKGIWVSVSQRPPETKSPAEIPPVIVRLEDAGPGFPPRLYVNSTPVSWEVLESALKRELKTRPVWVVYVEADSNVAWAYVVNVADIVRGLEGKFVLLTSETAKTLAR
jgi:biopolymer transport protein ExbD